MDKDFKNLLLRHCRRLLEERIANSDAAMKRSQESANSEEKSSAGDKYETSKAMGQLDRDMYAKQLAEARHELDLLNQINFEKQAEQIVAGSVIHTTSGLFFIAVGIGRIEFKGKQVTVLSLKAPLAKMLVGKRVGEEFELNGKSVRIGGVE